MAWHLNPIDKKETLNKSNFQYYKRKNSWVVKLGGSFEDNKRIQLTNEKRILLQNGGDQFKNGAMLIWTAKILKSIEFLVELS